jgi:putative PIG3 family NAD(P)H quinone oxidoreductase
MRAVTIVDGRLQVAEHTDPEPGAGEVLVRVQAAGLNGADMLQLRGRYPAPPGAPQDVPGLELAGVVEATGTCASRFSVGDRVMGIVAGGGQAELAVVHERQLMPVPDGLAWPQAGGFPEVVTTAHDALVTQAGLRPGDRLLVHGASGGVGTAAVQVGRLIGAHVIAVSRHPGHAEELRRLGASVVAGPEDFAGHGPFDVVLELVGAQNLDANLRSLATGGRIMVIGIGAGAKAEINLALLLAKRGRLLGSTLRARPLEEKALTARAVERELLGSVDAGRLEIPVAETFPLDQAEAAYARFGEGGKLGKIVLVPQ